MKFSMWLTKELDPAEEDLDHEVFIEVEFDDENGYPADAGDVSQPLVILKSAVRWSEFSKAYVPYPLDEVEFDRIIEESLARRHE